MNGSIIQEIKGAITPTTCIKNAVIIIICAIMSPVHMPFFYWGIPSDNGILHSVIRIREQFQHFIIGVNI